MYRYLCLLFLVVLSNSILAQENSLIQIKKMVDVPIIAYWQKGNTWKYVTQKGNPNEASKVEESEPYIFNRDYGLLLEYEHTDTKNFGGEATVKFALLKILN